MWKAGEVEVGSTDRPDDSAVGNESYPPLPRVEAPIEGAAITIQGMVRWIRLIPVTAFAAMVITLALALLIPRDALVIDSMAYGNWFVPIALATWLVGGCWLAATFPDAAGALARRRRSAAVGIIILLVAGALSIRLDRVACAPFISFTLAWFAMSAGAIWILRAFGAGLLEFTTAWDQMPDFGDPALLPSEYAAVCEEISKREEAVIRTLSPAGRDQFSVFTDVVKRTQEDPVAGSELEISDLTQIEGGDTDEMRSYQVALVRVLHLLSINMMQRYRAAFGRFAPMTVALTRLATGMRALGPALLAFGFVVAWVMIYMAVWLIDPLAWQGLGHDTTRFGDFVYIAVSGAFGGGGDAGISAKAPAAQMISLAEAISAATVLALYLRIVWEGNKEYEAKSPTG